MEFPSSVIGKSNLNNAKWIIKETARMRVFFTMDLIPHILEEKKRSFELTIELFLLLNEVMQLIKSR